MAERPCKVDLCPALAMPGTEFCIGHQFAKKLNAVHKGSTCMACERVLVEGDYVTRDSTPGNLRHAVCPKDRPKPQGRRRGETPLFDGE